MKTTTLFFLVLFFTTYQLIYGQKIIQSKVLLNTKAELGEGSMWQYKQNLLYWVDIDKGILYTYSPSTGAEESYELGQKVGTVVPIDTGGMMVALKDGIYSFNPNSKKLTFLVSPEKDKAGNRFNDGKCDPAGRFWVGSIGPRFQASLYKVTSDGKATQMLDSVSTSNGIVWTSDKKTMYYIDTNTGMVRAYDYDNKTGEIKNERVVIKYPKGIGYPDGMSIDAEGKLWIAHWGGSCVGSWDPLTGQMIAKIEVAAPNVTSCAFGGKNLDILYITTASTGMTDEAKKQYPNAGKVFVANPGVKGTKANFFKTR